MLVAGSQDRIQQRALVSIVVTVVSMIGWVLLGVLDLVHHVKVGYFQTYLLTFGTFVPMLLVPAWEAQIRSLHLRVR